MNPLEILNKWTQEELNSGAAYANNAVLATVAKDSNIPNSRVVAIRESNEQGILFFTQRNTKKVQEIISNPIASMTFWFELKAREVIINGVVEAISEEENEKYWKSYPREAQIRFYGYASTSAQPINNKKELEEKREGCRQEFADQAIPLHPLYCGFRLKPSKFIFYTFNSGPLSDVEEYEFKEGNWNSKLLSP